ncbi:hypothetical protein IMZ48_36080 [Candidatus Bathyarchaeota archaeon]|nr:hypothetical protein [Candidatus Bathyarchaeota archaeon]
MVAAKGGPVLGGRQLLVRHVLRRRDRNVSRPYQPSFFFFSPAKLRQNKTKPFTNSPSLIVCGIYYALWIHILPKWKGYAIRAEVLDVDGGDANAHRLVRVPLGEVAQWDGEHDDAGRLLPGFSTESDGGSGGKAPGGDKV